MKVFVTAKPGAKREEVVRFDETHFAVAVKEPPVAGRANAAIAKALAAHLSVAPSRMRIISGFSSKQKVFEIFGSRTS